MLASGECAQSPVMTVFYHPKNQEHILTQIFKRTGVRESTMEHIYPFMRVAINRFPGSYQPQFFRSQEEYTATIMEHVDRMNEFVILWAAQEVKAGSEFMNEYYKRLTGQLPMPDRPSASTTPSQSRKSNSVLLRDATQWTLFGNKYDCKE